LIVERAQVAYFTNHLIAKKMMESFAIFSNNPLRRIQDQIANPGKVYMAGCGEK